MERVKEESRRKSEELEYLRNTMQQGAYLSPQPQSHHQYQYQSQSQQQQYHQHQNQQEPESVYSRTAVRGETLSHRGFQDLGAALPTSRQVPDDDYIMDFSKPAGYHPPPPSSSSSQFTQSTVRRDSVREPSPVILPADPTPVQSNSSAQSARRPPSVPPALPTNPPRRHSSSIPNRDVIRRSLTPPAAPTSSPPKREQQQEEKREEGRKPVEHTPKPAPKPVIARPSMDTEVSALRNNK